MSIIKNSVRAILIVVPKFGSSFLPNYFGQLKHPESVHSISMYCKDVKKCKGWAEKYSIVKHFDTNIL